MLNVGLIVKPKSRISIIKSKYLDFSYQPEGHSLESSSYWNVTLRYLGPWDPWTLGPLDLGTLGPLPSSTTSSYFLLHSLTSSSPPLAWFGMGGMLSFDIGDRDWRCTRTQVFRHWRLRLEMDLQPLY